MRNTIYLTFQGPDVILDRPNGHRLILTVEEAKELYEKLSDAYGPLTPPPDTTLAPTDCIKCVVQVDEEFSPHGRNGGTK